MGKQPKGMGGFSRNNLKRGKKTAAKAPSKQGAILDEAEEADVSGGAPAASAAFPASLALERRNRVDLLLKLRGIDVPARRA